MNYKNIIVEELDNGVGIITLNRPEAYNAINNALLAEVSNAIKDFDANPDIAAVVLTGGEKVFAAGADIKELAELDFASAYQNEFIKKEWYALEHHIKPIIAAISGYALGGGCEMALLCDIAICDKSAKFGQPEVKIGTMPGAGGTQRLTKAIGKSKAMHLCLTGDIIDAEEAASFKLVSQIVDHDVKSEAIKIAQKIAKMSKPVVRLIKESINNAYESNLQAGLAAERQSFYTTLALEDRIEGMEAFIQKRPPNFKN
ncbi:enoyl-CoA hydratase-related protein [Sulfurospirillum sp. 1612]|uniref:enoyl-CoA hydratase-related protein n=1 Tax=Sulfurospirillum sp. 1612 TaxID=3094835 RepID=UPI002F94158C